MHVDIAWPGVFENWSRAFVARNHWRVSYSMDREDALQECALVFSQCYKRYIEEGDRVDNPAWFMSLYKTCVRNHFHGLSNQATRMLKISSLEVPRSEASESGEGPVLAALSELSKEAGDVLKTIAAAPTEFLQIALSPTATLDVWSRKLCRMSKTAVSSSVLDEIKSALGVEKMLYEDILNSVQTINPKFRTRTAKESDTDYAVRLLEALAGSTKEQFEEISDEAKSWFDVACEAANSKEEIPLPEGFPKAEEKKTATARKASAQKAAAEDGEVVAAERAVLGIPLGRNVVGPASQRGRRSSLNPNARINILVEGDLCKPEAKAYERFKAFRDGMTVREALDAGIFSADITYLRDTTKRISLSE